MEAVAPSAVQNGPLTPDDNVKTRLLGGADESGQIIGADEVPLPGFGLKGVPKDIRGHGVQAHGPGLDQPVFPVFLRDPLEVQFSGDDLERLSVEKEGRAFEAERGDLSGDMGGDEQRRGEKEEPGSPGPGLGKLHDRLLPRESGRADFITSVRHRRKPGTRIRFDKWG